MKFPISLKTRILLAILFVVLTVWTANEYYHYNKQFVQTKQVEKIAKLYEVPVSSPETPLPLPLSLSNSRRKHITYSKALLQQLYETNNELYHTFEPQKSELKAVEVILKEAKFDYNLPEIIEPEDLPSTLAPAELFAKLVYNSKAYQSLNNARLDQQVFIKSIEQQAQANSSLNNPLWGKTDNQLKELISHMSTREKAGQLLMFTINGNQLSAEQASFLSENTIGGVILMGQNIQDENQVKKLTSDLQRNSPATPLLIATDQEGGLVKRLNWDNTASANEWISLSEEELCQQAMQRAQTLHNVGINLNFAPVVDLTPADEGFINSRTISPDPSTVMNKAEVFSRCSRENFVSTTLKHYPGHGATLEDSHFVLPQIQLSKEEWLQTDALPFKKLTDTRLIMIGHLQFNQIDTNPSTYSHVLIDGILRTDFGYEGVVITDDMGQLHRSTGIEVRDAIKKVLNTETDILLYVNSPNGHPEVVQNTVELIESGEIPMDKVDSKVLRIMQLKRLLR